MIWVGFSVVVFFVVVVVIVNMIGWFVMGWLFDIIGWKLVFFIIFII